MIAVIFLIFLVIVFIATAFTVSLLSAIKYRRFPETECTVTRIIKSGGGRVHNGFRMAKTVAVVSYNDGEKHCETKIDLFGTGFSVGDRVYIAAERGEDGKIKLVSDMGYKKAKIWLAVSVCLIIFCVAVTSIVVLS